MERDICLLIFDECHHTKKKHSYLQLFEYYYHEIKDVSCRPHILGLTATPVSYIMKFISSLLYKKEYIFID